VWGLCADFVVLIRFDVFGGFLTFLGVFLTFLGGFDPEIRYFANLQFISQLVSKSTKIVLTNSIKLVKFCVLCTI